MKNSTFESLLSFRIHLKIFATLFLIHTSLILTSQSDNTYDDLLVLLVNEDYKDCFNKSIKYTTKDKTKKDPLPYLFAAKSAYRMSRDHKFTEEFPKAYKTAISYTTKYRKKDKKYIYKEDAEEFINEFKLNIYEEIENYILEATEKTYGKALGLSRKVFYMDPDDFGAKLLFSTLCAITKDRTTAREYFMICEPKLKECGDNKFTLKHMTKSQQLFLRLSIIEYAKYYKEKDKTKAKEIIGYGKHLFYDENDFSKIEYSLDYKFLHDDFN